MTHYKQMTIAILFLLSALLSGCKLVVVMVQGGEVQSIGSGTCLEGTVCTHNIINTSYAETYTAVPNNGWHFVKWNTGDEFLCADSTNPVCVINNTSLAGNPGAEAVVATNKPFYIMPVFAAD